MTNGLDGRTSRSRRPCARGEVLCGGPRTEAPMVDDRLQVGKEARRLRHCRFGSRGKSEWAEKSWPASQVMSGGENVFNGFSPARARPRSTRLVQFFDPVSVQLTGKAARRARHCPAGTPKPEPEPIVAAESARSGGAASRRAHYLGSSIVLTCAATTRQPSGNRTQVCI
jgi:hypothetical protein